MRREDSRREEKAVGRRSRKEWAGDQCRSEITQSSRHVDSTLARLDSQAFLFLSCTAALDEENRITCSCRLQSAPSACSNSMHKALLRGTSHWAVTPDRPAPTATAHLSSALYRAMTTSQDRLPHAPLIYDTLLEACFDLDGRQQPRLRITRGNPFVWL